MHPVVRPQALRKLYDQSVCVSQRFLGRHFHRSCFIGGGAEWERQLKVIVDPEVFNSHLLNQSKYNDIGNNWPLTATQTMQKMLRRWKNELKFLLFKNQHIVVL